MQNAFDQAHAQAEQKFDDVKSAPSIPLFIDNQACLSVTNHPNNSTKSRHIALREFRIRDYHELGIIRPYWCPTAAAVTVRYLRYLRYRINDSQFGSTSASICTRSSRFGPGHPSPRPRPNGPRDDGHGAAISPSQITK